MNYLKEDLLIIQHNMNALSIKWKLLTQWVSKDVLNIFINEYDKLITPIIYP